MNNYLSYIPIALELAAFVFSIIYFSKYKNSNEKYFMYFIGYTLMVEITGAILGDVFLIDNSWLYNIFTFSSFLFYFHWYFNILKRPNFKKTVIPFTVIFIVMAIYSLFTQSWEEYHTYTFFTGAIFLLVLTIFHFYQLLNSNEVLVVKYKLSFWISTALLLFYMGMIPIIFLMEYTDVRVFSYLIIIISLNAVLYGCYITGFIWTKKKYNGF